MEKRLINESLKIPVSILPWLRQLLDCHETLLLSRRRTISLPSHHRRRITQTLPLTPPQPLITISGWKSKAQSRLLGNLIRVPIAIGGPGLAPGVWFCKDLPSGGLANVAATMINLHGFEAPADYEPSLIEVVDN
ncbi:2,3-bisphosphoglycerate-independent phosphoglycerate mutase-like [Rosa rugosa]|uniref:2,3-bisphosphoglycerate-independent phosphoglycerate mutase-like n=1 Tax=Rosa rugosa TaxID=74645 RepID=UPI002B413FC5|nr:2,3-bisphosphoglycerate-independent phosphoglycerate mutase-like [Rosa rugosa]